VQRTLEFPDLVTLIDDRSAAFRPARAAAPSLDVTVPSCPEWTLFDLARHLGEGRRAWAATVAAGPGATSKAAPGGPAAPRDRDALTVWLAASTQLLLDALREAGPERGCWTWWGNSQSPPTCAAVARHQLQEVTVHTYDAQLTVGEPQPLPVDVALDGVDEFLSTCCATTAAWPHEPATVDYHATEGRSWRVELSAAGARTGRAPTNSAPATAAASGTAGELVLLFYGRIPLDALKLEGDPRVFDQLIAWDPSL